MKSNIPSQASQAKLPAEADDAWENDLVWDLLRQSPSRPAAEGFADAVMKSVKQSQAAMQTSPWGHPWLRMAAGVAAALLVSLVWWSQAPSDGGLDSGTEVVVVDEFAPLEEVVTQQVLLAAADQLHDFSDTELVTLIGF
jgi:hypothetical protein